MNHEQSDDLAGWKQRRQEEWNAKIAAEMAAIRSREAEYDPATIAEIHTPLPRRPRQERRGPGHRLTGTQELLLQQLAFLNDLGIATVSIPELAQRVGCSRRGIQYSLARLIELRYVAREIRPSHNPRHHLPSKITVLPAGWVRINRIGPSPVLSGTQKQAHPSEINNNNSCTKVERSAAAASPSSARATPSAAARPEPEKPAEAEMSLITTGKEVGKTCAPGHPAPSVESTEAARKAAAALHPARAPIIETLDPFDVIDAVRMQRLSRFHHQAWQRAVEIHGREKALLSAAVALMRSKDRNSRPIRSAASYLGGMLRVGPGQLNPIPSLRVLLAREV
ncbi:hypothetical protein [Ferrovibrio sp.]|uniref:hypothetical protein n=1 Tax=Ferrovibrio sp. TaxID=1917215 RepID=UPI000CA75563|nr:hypothetical protein [Ferrovibrio sp.]PJI41821.1 MAG: hypothetical protein CTR53_04995 [Ferrovibrio sp.]